MANLWKGILGGLVGSRTEPDFCDAEMKVGMQVPNSLRCELSRNHIGHHRNRLTTWARTPQEMKEHIAELNRRERDEG